LRLAPGEPGSGGAALVTEPMVRAKLAQPRTPRRMAQARGRSWAAKRRLRRRLWRPGWTGSTPPAPTSRRSTSGRSAVRRGPSRR